VGRSASMEKKIGDVRTGDAVQSRLDYRYLLRGNGCLSVVYQLSVETLNVIFREEGHLAHGVKKRLADGLIPSDRITIFPD